VKETSRAASAQRKPKILPGLSARDGYTPHPFDIENQVKTSGLIPGRHLKSGHRHDRHSTAYFGVAPSVFHALLRRWQRSRPAAPLEDFTFVDVGAGMGRAALLAAELPFRRVIGIELNPILARIARKNISLWRAAGRVLAPTRLICGDAAEYSFPTGPSLVFLFNPFGATVMRRLLSRIAARNARLCAHLDLLYVNNEQEHVLECQSGFTRLFLGQIRRSRADAIADHKIMANQPKAEYMSANYEDCSIWRLTG
jgi:SAM-dependent methyltransferase